MSGVIKAVEWAETAEDLHERYKAETDIKARKRPHPPWNADKLDLLSSGGSPS